VDAGNALGQSLCIRGIRHPPRSTRTFAFAGTALLALSGCAGALAPLADEALPPAAAAGQDARVSVALPPERVQVEVRVNALATHTLQIPAAAARWSAPRGRLDQSLIEVEFELDAAASAPQKIADIAMSPHFLNTAQFPRGRLEGRWIRPRAAQGSSHELFFDLTLKNRVRHLLAPATLSRAGCDVRMVTEFRIDRQRFGIASDSNYEKLVADAIEVRIEASTPSAPFGVPCAEPPA
jgi:polyisoprenoid-binding protein YceI